MIKIEFDPKNYNQIFPVVLDSVEYMFHLGWNNAEAKRGFRDSGWELSIYDSSLLNIDTFLSSGDAQYNALIQGEVKLMPNQQILNRAYFKKLPSGILFCGDRYPEEGLSDEEYYIGLDNFGSGKRFDLYYTTEEELSSL